MYYGKLEGIKESRVRQLEELKQSLRTAVILVSNTSSKDLQLMRTLTDIKDVYGARQ